MTIKKRVRNALLIGVTAELILTVPLFMVSPRLEPGQLPRWVAMLTELQMPGYALVLHLVQAGWTRQLAARFEIAHQIFLAAQALIVVIQAILFSLVAMTLVYVWERRGSWMMRLPPG